MSKAVATKEEAALPAAFAEEMAADAGDGTQTITTDDMAVPFLRILQKMSPQLSKRDGAYVAGSEEGMIFNTVTGEVYDGEEGVQVVMCGFNTKHIEWKPRELGGGIAGVYAVGEPLPPTTKNDKGQDTTEQGNLLSPTAEHYVFVLGKDGSWEQALMSMSSTQLKVSRKWNSLVQHQLIDAPDGSKVKAPMYGVIYRVKTVVESNDQGEWCGWSITCEGLVQDINMYHAAKEFSQNINQGKVIVNDEKNGDTPF